MSSGSRRARVHFESTKTAENPPTADALVTDMQDAEHEKRGTIMPTSFPPLPDTKPPEAVDPSDLQTPDNWIKRNPSLIRLTGKHPFNCEAPLKDLFDAGFLTPPELFYVRNHGAVPKVEGETLDNWSIRVHGLVEREVSLTLADLKTLFPIVTLPITLVCAGNRRKEQNIVRKGLGFNWGAAGLSTALWTGVYLADIINYVKPIRPKAKYIIFEGTDALPNGPYGTSQRLSWASSKEKGMLIAWRMNGELLEPDHGFPVRLVVPGQIGGRSVKWLNRMEISSEESQHYLHFWDNKVLPTQVMPEQARAEAHWWYDPLYIINDLNVNSVIAKPNHNDLLFLPHGEENDATYSMQGYAYTGGGNRVARVEISLDGGDSWALASLTYPEDLYRTARFEDEIYGTLDMTERETCFCWCFWTFDLPISRLGHCEVLLVRGMDESLAQQPKDMYWNATGMMNNWWFRVAVHKVRTDDSTMLRFEHPTLAGIAPGGWMQRMQEAGQDILKPIFSDVRAPPSTDTVAKPRNSDVLMTKPGVRRMISMAELRRQDKSSPWFVVKGEVYDGTGFLDEHPGGADSIFISAGEDVTDDFMAIHSPEGKLKLAGFHIGTLDVSIGPLSRIARSLSRSRERSRSRSRVRTLPQVDEAFLHRAQWKTARLSKITPASHDSFVFRFELDHPNQPLGLSVGQHVFVRLRRKTTGELVQRAYTPVTKQDENGVVDLLVKVYYPNSMWPSGGKMSLGFSELIVGDTVEMKGPLGSFTWEGRGVAVWKGVRRKVKNVGLICGGSGITPILQVLRAVLGDKEDKETRLWLLDTNKTEQDILCRDELDTLSQMYKDGRFILHYTVSKPPQSWSFSKGRISDEMLAIHLPPPGDETLVLTCGPDPLIKLTIKPGLERLGWNVARSLVVF